MFPIKYSYKVLAVILLFSAIITGLVVWGVFYLEEREMEVIEFMQSANTTDTEQMKYYGEILGYFLWGVIAVFFLVVITTIVLRGKKKHERLKHHGDRTYCKVLSVEKKADRDEYNEITGYYKEVKIKTPLGKGGVYRFPVDKDIEVGDSVLIVFDPNNADFFNLAKESGEAVVRKM
jgi:hypothetical protein